MNYIKTERAQHRGYSPAVITEGGRIVWLARQTATVDNSGRSLVGDFDRQARQIFAGKESRLYRDTSGVAGTFLSSHAMMT